MRIDFNCVYKIHNHEIFSERDGNYIVLFPEIPFWIATAREGLEFINKIDGISTINEVTQSVFETVDQNVLDMVADFLISLKESNVLYENEKIQPVKNTPEKPNKITFLQTMNCNLKCKHCSVSEYSSNKLPSMDLETAKNALDNIEKIMSEGEKKIAFLGGEPLVGNKFKELVRYAHQKGFKLGLSTNGTLIDEEYAKLFKACNVNVQVSLDGPTKESHEEIRGFGTWEKTIAAISLLKKHDVDIQTNMVYHKGNFHLIEKYFELCRELNIKSVRLISLMNIGNAAKEGMESVPTDEFVKEMIRLIEKDPSIIEYMDDTSFMGLVMVAKFSQRLISCGAGVITLTIDPNGDVYPCLNIHESKYLIGNVFDDDFQAKFEKSTVIQAFKSIRIDELNNKCNACNLKYYCGGRCRGETLQILNDINAPYPNCLEWRKSMESIFWLLTTHPEIGESKYKKIIDNSKEYISLC